MLRNIGYAILLGVGMAACLSESESENTTATTPQPVEKVAEESIKPEPDPSEFILAKGRAGSIKIGMPITEIRNNIPAGFTIQDSVLLQEGTEATAYVLRPVTESKGIIIEQTCEPDCKVWRIAVKSPAYKTAAGIGIGSKYGEVQARYPISFVGLARAFL